MAQFYQIVDDYLEEYQTDKAAELREVGRYRTYVDHVVAQLYSETERVYGLLKVEYPEKGEEQLRLYAEGMAIAHILPIQQAELSRTIN